jgi:predicted RNase H-like HicB family nuclease
MKQVRIIIEKSDDQYTSYAENVDGVYGGGDTPEEAKESALHAITLLKKHRNKAQIPAIIKGDYQVVFRFDTVSILNYYRKVFTNAALERMTGINQKQIQHYASGLKKPRAAQVRKIKTAFHNLGSELIAIEL